MVFLAAEAAVLEARLGALREALVSVDARIEAISGALRRMRGSAEAAAGSHDAFPPGAGRSLPCSP
jgi:hypothetical protein